MKHLQTFESFLNESQKMTFQELVDKYKDNPYSIGAQSVEFIEGKQGNPNMLVFRHDDRLRLNNVEANLKSFGFDKKKMSRSTQDKAYKYRYELNLYESADFVNEASDKKPAILVKLYNELAKAKNKKTLSWYFDRMAEFPHIIKFENGLESESGYHKGEMEEYSFYLNDDGKTILGIYDLNGDDEELKTVKDAINWSRANE